MIQAAGVYVVLNTLTGKEYVGSATNLRRRWYEHQSALRRGVHHSAKLQRSWKKHGAAAFTFKPLLVCAPEMSVFYEQRAIEAMEPWYNMSPTAGSSLGVKHTPETRARMSAANKGKVLTPEHRANMSAAQKGRRPTEATKAKISEAHRGLGHSEATKKKLADINRGKEMPAAVRRKISAALKGVAKPPRTEQHSQRIAAANKGRGLGSKKSPETIAKMRVAARARVEKQRLIRAEALA